jgi:hypothetical protein
MVIFSFFKKTYMENSKSGESVTAPYHSGTSRNIFFFFIIKYANEV